MRSGAARRERCAILLIADDNNPQRARAGGTPSEATLKALDESDAALCGILVTPSKDTHKEARAGMNATSAAANPFLAAPMILSEIFSKRHSGGGGASYYAERTDGVAILANHDDVARVFIEMMGMLGVRYMLGYRPPALPANDKLREIKLAINAPVLQEQGETIIIVRRGYYSKR